MRRFKESWTGIDKQALLYTFCCHEHIGWLHIILISSVQFCCSVMANSLQPHGLHYSRLSCPSPTPGACSNSCPSSQSMMPSNHFILCHPLLLLLSIFPSIRSFQMSQFFTSGGQSIGFCFSISPSNEHWALISFRIAWFDLLAVQGTLKSLLQHHSSKALFLWCSAFFTIQLSHPNTTSGKTIALTRPLSVK